MAKILIIDDDGAVCDALEIFLARDGHLVSKAADGGKGVQAYQQNVPDLVVLDRDLPVMTGSAVLKKIREVSAATPVVMLTGYDNPEDAAEYLRAGATAILSKKDGLLKALDEIDHILGLRKKAPAPAAPRPAAPAAAAAGRGIVLVVDDDEATVNALARHLSSLGYEALQAGDGDRAVELARARQPDIVLLDIKMPGKDGVAVLRELVPELPYTGFIMLTGNEDKKVAQACLKIGALNYLTKPADMAAINELIKGWILCSPRH